MTNFNTRSLTASIGLETDEDELSYDQILKIGRALSAVQASAHLENAGQYEYPTAEELFKSPGTQAGLRILGGDLEAISKHNKVTFYSWDPSENMIFYINLDARTDRAGRISAFQRNAPLYGIQSFGSLKVVDSILTLRGDTKTWEANITFLKNSGVERELHFTSDLSELPKETQALYPEDERVPSETLEALNGFARIEPIYTSTYMVDANSSTPAILEVTL